MTTWHLEAAVGEAWLDFLATNWHLDDSVNTGTRFIDENSFTPLALVKHE